MDKADGIFGIGQLPLLVVHTVAVKHVAVGQILKPPEHLTCLLLLCLIALGPESFHIRKEKVFQYFLVGMSQGCASAHTAIGINNRVGHVDEEQAVFNVLTILPYLLGIGDGGQRVDNDALAYALAQHVHHAGIALLDVGHVTAASVRARQDVQQHQYQQGEVPWLDMVNDVGDVAGDFPLGAEVLNQMLTGLSIAEAGRDVILDDAIGLAVGVQQEAQVHAGAFAHNLANPHEHTFLLEQRFSTHARQTVPFGDGWIVQQLA